MNDAVFIINVHSSPFLVNVAGDMGNLPPEK
jgi:hypothetical protein